MSGSLGEAVLDLVADHTKLFKDIDEAKPKALAAFDALGKAGGALIAAGITTAATAIVGITTMVWNAGQTIDAAYDTIRTETGATGAELEGLQADFDAVFTSVPTNADDAAQAVSILNQRLGLTGPILQDTSGSLLEMTRLMGGDLATNGELFTRFIGDAGIATEDASSAMDTLFVASQKTGTGVDQLMRLAVQFGAPMRQFGFSWQESVAMLGKWEKEGVNTELVMGSLRIAAGKFARENVPLRDGLQDTFEKIKNAKDESEGLAIAMDVFGARAGPDMAAAIRENRFELGDLVAQIQDSNGAIMETSEATMDWGERWTLFKNRITDALGASGMGLMDSVNAGLRAIEDLVARPEIQNGFMAIVNWIVYLVQVGAENLPKLIDQFFAIVAWLQNNQGVIVAILAVIGAAIAAFVWTTVIPAAVATITALAPIIAVIALIGAAAYLLYQAWTNNWGGIQEKVAAVIAFLQPLFQQFITNLVNLWQNVLWPAIQAVWNWMSTVLWPFLQVLGDFLGTVFSMVITALAGIWENVLWPAVKKFVDWAAANIIPVLEPVAKFFGERMVQAFQNISKTIQIVTEWLQKLTDKLKNIHLPDWMTPGSPTPWEIGLLGVDNALKKISSVSLPNLSGTMNLMPAPAFGTNALFGSGNAQTNSTIEVGDIIIYTSQNADPQQVGQEAKQGVLSALRAKGAF